MGVETARRALSVWVTTIGRGDGPPGRLYVDQLMKIRWLQVLLLSAGLSACAAMPNPTLKVGDAAPDFALPDQNGQTIRLSDFRGKQSVVLAFYIKAFTSG